MKKTIFYALAALSLASCGHKSVEISVANPTDLVRSGEMVEVPADSVLSLLDASYCYVQDSSGMEIPSQITFDGHLIFQVDVQPGATAKYRVLSSDAPRTYPQLTSGRLYPERADDVAWENENVGFRIYGPSTQAKGERAFGYDIFFKHPTSDQILEDLYGAQTSAANWECVDSLRAIDPEKAEEYVRSFTYHVDHGQGMDCYAVGPTLGDGVAALVYNDTIRFPWCYETAEVLDNGPLRFTVQLQFAPVNIGAAQNVTEHRIISLDAGSYLNRGRVWYDGLGETFTVVTGFPRRDDSPAVMDPAAGILAYADPTQGPDNGKAMLGLVLDGQADRMQERDGHILAYTSIAPSDTLDYRWGFAWDRSDLKNMAEWEAELRHVSGADRSPLRVSILK